MATIRYDSITQRIFTDNITVIGIDPALDHTGIAVIRQSGSLAHIQTEDIKTDSNASIAERLLELGEALERLFEKYPDFALIGVETVYTAFGKHYDTTRLAQARGVIAYVSMKTGRRVIEIQPTIAKKVLVGSGTAKKSQMKKAVEHQLGITPKNQHTADAIAIAMTAGRMG